MLRKPTRPHRPFALVLGGGGARGFAHLGVLRALEHYGYRPCFIVGVSMGAVRAGEIRNGYQALVRAMDICHRQHAHVRFAAADLVLRPVFNRNIDTLEFSARRECVEAGVRVVRAERESIRALLKT